MRCALADGRQQTEVESPAATNNSAVCRVVLLLAVVGKEPAAHCHHRVGSPHIFSLSLRNIWTVQIQLILYKSAAIT